MLTLSERVVPEAPEWQPLYEKLPTSVTLASLVLTAWQIGWWFAKRLVEQQLNERAKRPEPWGNCAKCAHRLQSQGFVSRRMLTLVGWVGWKRRVGRCPHQCESSHCAPDDRELGILPYEPTSVEWMRLGCLVAVFVAFELAAWRLAQLSGVRLSDATLWQWVQGFGPPAMHHLDDELQLLSDGQSPAWESLEERVAALPLVIAAAGVTLPLRPTPRSAKGKVVWREVKVARLTRWATQVNRVGQSVTRLLQRRLVAVLGDMDALQPRLQLETLRPGIQTAPQVVWISDGARGFWRLFEDRFADVAIGILDFDPALGHLWRAADAYGKTIPARTPQQWFERMRHQLRHGSVHQIIKELGWLLKYNSTPESAKPTLRQVHGYLNTHFHHWQSRQFKKQGLPIGSGLVESTCKWLIAQRFKGVAMRWSEPGFHHLLHLRLAWVNQRFDPWFSQESLSLSLHSPNR